MCIKNSKRLNPEAKEWRPTPQPLLPHQICSPVSAAPPPLPASQIVPLTASPPQNLPSSPEQPFYYPHPLPGYYHQGLIIPYTGYPDLNPFYYGSTATPMAVNTHTEEVDVKAAAGGRAGDMEENLKTPPVKVFRKGCRKVFPPRLQKAQRRFIVEETPPPSPSPRRKIEWRPKKTSVNTDVVVSGAGDSHSSPTGSASPPPSRQSGFCCSKTTVMIKNIPNQLRRDFMLNFLDNYCKLHTLEYDFLYLPMDFKRRDNLGYAFVNFTSAVAAMKIKQALQGFQWRIVQTDRGSISSQKICDITWARIQGKEALIRRFERSNFVCDSLDFLPVILDPARNGSDPNPPPPVILGSLSPSL